MLAVPSVIVPQEVNYVVNPEHADFTQIEIGRAERFAVDARLGKRGGKPRR